MLGLALFNSLHIVGEINWIIARGALSGNNSMEFMDWFDVVLRGIPWGFFSFL